MEDCYAVLFGHKDRAFHIDVLSDSCGDDMAAFLANIDNGYSLLAIVDSREKAKTLIDILDIRKDHNANFTKKQIRSILMQLSALKIPVGPRANDLL